jgi:probable F420-dependent oxidoreductase
MTDVRLGVALSTSAAPGADPGARARRAEALGFDLLTVSDHLAGTHPTFETWTALTWAAAVTQRILLAPLVLGLPYRAPALIAKMAESLDRLSGGRLILGLGGGGNDAEFSAFGLPVRPPREKVDALEEAIRIIRGLWSEPVISFEGAHYRVREAAVEPKPSRPIPIWTGSYGPRSLALTGRLADGWNPSLPYAPPEEVTGMRERVRRAAVDAGRDPDAITCAYNVSVDLRDGARDDPRVLGGGPDRVAARLAGFVRLGFPTICLWVRGGEDSLERVAAEVVPAVRREVA